MSATATRLAALEPATADGVQELLRAATDADGSAPVGEHGLRRLHSEGPHLVVQDTGGRPIGYAQLEQVEPGQWSAELAVHPAARRRGVGASLVRALLAESGAAEGSGQTLRVWAHGELPGAVALADTFEFRQVRALWQLRRGLAEPELGPVELPAGVRLRTFVVGQDEADFLRVNNAAFDWHPEQGGWDLAQLREREADPWFDPPGFLLAVEADSGRLLGYHWTKVHAEPEQIGEVYVLGVDPEAHGRGLGGALTLAGLHYLRERGLAEVMLYVEADNQAAVRVYQKLGFTHWHTDSAYAIGP